MENLRIPRKYKRTGLYVFCNKCKRYSNIDDGYLKKFEDCSHPPEKQRFKYKTHVPNSKRLSKIKVFNTRDIKEVDKLIVEFLDLLKQNNYNLNKLTSPKEKNPNNYLLLYQMEKYIQYKENGGFYDFETPRAVTTDTIKDYKRHFRYFLASIDEYFDIRKLRVDELQKEHIDAFHRYIRKRSNSDKTYNNIMNSLRGFYKHLIEYEELNIRNLFSKVKVITVYSDPKVFNEDEFYAVISSTTSENGYDKKWKRNLYREWLPAAFKLGLYTCLRLEELVYLKYSDIIEVDGVLIIESLNRKATKLIVSNVSNQKRIKRVPVVPRCLEVLIQEFDFDNYKGTERYVIAPGKTRGTVYTNITRGFTHFKRIAGIEEDKCFKDLRKTFMNILKSEYGYELSNIISDHSNEDVSRKHYFSQIEAAKKAKDLEIF